MQACICVCAIAPPEGRGGVGARLVPESILDMLSVVAVARGKADTLVVLIEQNVVILQNGQGQGMRKFYWKILQR